MNHSLEQGLTNALARIGLAQPTGLERLSGGANMESWRFTAGDELCVLRRAPSLEMMAGRPMDHHDEAALIRAAHGAGVMAPEVLVELEPEDAIGSGYVMRCIAGSPDPNAMLAEADPSVTIRDIARELVAVHRTACSGLPVPVMDTAAALAELRRRFLEYGGDRQGFLPFSEIHPDYYQIPIADRQRLLEEAAAEINGDDEEEAPRGGGEGKDKGQAVAYLPDGTMVVVNNGQAQIGQQVETVVQSVIQTGAGIIVFADLRSTPTT